LDNDPKSEEENGASSGGADVRDDRAHLCEACSAWASSGETHVRETGGARDD
jgi:hypothetical protein